MSKGVKFLSTEKLQSYTELLQNMAYDIQDVGVKASLAEGHNAITTVEKDKLHKELYEKVTLIDKKLLECLDEMNRRLKLDLGLPYGFKDINKFLEKYKTSHPNIYLTESEFKFKVSEEAKNKKLTAAKDIVAEKIPKKLKISK